jgi:hypothetical protein
LRKYRIIIYLAVIAAAILIFAISIYQDYYPPTKPVERFFHISIPENAIDVQAQYDWAFQGGNYFLQFKLPSESFDDFKRKVCGDQELSADFNQEADQYRDMTPSWWLPDVTSISVSARCLFPRGGDFEFFVDRSDENLFAIYMRGFLW